MDADGNGEISFGEFRDMIYKLFGIEQQVPVSALDITNDKCNKSPIEKTLKTEADDQI